MARHLLHKWVSVDGKAICRLCGTVGALCWGDQGCDGSGRLPNGERCDLCERFSSDSEVK